MVTYRLGTGEVLGSNPSKDKNFKVVVKISNCSAADVAI